MKKIMFLIIAFILLISNAKAENLNFRTNILAFNTYIMEDKTNVFAILTNNINEKILFTLHPNNNPTYTTNYQKEKYNLDELEDSLKEKIKASIYETETAENFETQMYFYIHTQMLIWKSFHPSLNLQMGPEMKEYAGTLEKYKVELEKRVNFIPEWIKDYEMEDLLNIPKEEGYNLTSKDCKIESTNDQYIISECKKDAQIIVQETKEESLIIYENADEKYIEGISPRSWVLNITRKENIKEENIEENNVPNEEEQEREENKDETIDQKNESYTITNVPNTKETNQVMIWLTLIIVLNLYLTRK